jgi:hypothetical protein
MSLYDSNFLCADMFKNHQNTPRASLAVVRHADLKSAEKPRVTVGFLYESLSEATRISG